ncbi:histone H2B-like [Apteryx mantelli]|uniref:Histone H2B-like n=1 Tax=Apteryx mantelli TaxID=2696672 RepID=A0ABM4FXQ9_9AVES
MASATGRRRRSRQQRRRRSYRRKSPAKSPKSQSTRKRKNRPGRKGNSYDSKILQRLRRGNHNFSCLAKGLMRDFLNNIYTEVSIKAEHLRRHSRLQTVGSSQVKAALQEVMLEKGAERWPAPIMKNSL